MEKTMIIVNQSYYINHSSSSLKRSDDDFLEVLCAGSCHVNKKFFNRNKQGLGSYYIQYLVGGHMDVEADGELCRMEEGDMIVYAPNTPFFYAGDERTCYLWLHFTGRDADRIFAECGLQSKHIYHLGLQSALLSAFERMFAFFLKRERFLKLRLAQRTIKLLTDVAGMVEMTERSEGDERISQSIAFIHQNSARQWTVAELAHMVYLSEGHFRVLFQKHCGMSPRQYLISLRISNAKQLLEESSLGVGQIAEQVGFEDALYFSRMFHRVEGCSPRAYRERVANARKG
jgi:AraC-like DNA-binding protein